jgi:hypothetical protein
MVVVDMGYLLVEDGNPWLEEAPLALEASLTTPALSRRVPESGRRVETGRDA